jgi:hypothetical protein
LRRQGRITYGPPQPITLFELSIRAEADS